MTIKRIIGMIVALAGVALLFLSNYIAEQVTEGRAQISDAESQVGTGRQVFGLNPVSKQIGEKTIFNPADKKIAAGKEEVARYEVIARRAKMGGIVLIVVGFGIFIIPFKRRR